MNKGQTAASMVYQIKSLILKHREFIVYGIVGILTTAVSWLAAYVLKLFLNDQIAWQNVAINTLSWVAAIAFAYPANRQFVFESKNRNVFRECMEFVGSRIATGVMEVALMSLTVNVMDLDFWLSKLLVSVIVIVANYVLSKLVVFKAKEKEAFGRIRVLLGEPTGLFFSKDKREQLHVLKTMKIDKNKNGI